ncbi:MAG: carbon monoxide dehydrogenase [Chloroflexi bacterium]|nr:carbon monoxide dehydrogenase [Chloroflexota bacterium]
MQFTGSTRIRAPQEQVWHLLLDPDALRHCLPGCTRFEQAAPDTYEATVTLGIGAVRGSYNGRVHVRDPQEPHRYTLAAEGSGSTGTVRGSAAITLSATPDGTTIQWSADAQIGGIIANVGQRLLGGVARSMADQFFRCMEGRLANVAGETTEPARTEEA